ncbi:MAG: shikimate dehydrogenase [Dehalococcoidia bacterium]
MTQRLAIIGDPVGHSISPAIYNATFPAMGIDAHYEAWPTPRDEVAAAIEKLRADDMMGMNVTVPHKEAVLDLLDEVEPGARAIGAVNCITKRDGRLIGFNTDKAGFVESLRNAGFDPSLRRVLVLGVGGSARAVCVGLIEAGVANLTLAGRRSEAVASLAAHLRATHPEASIDEVSMDVGVLGVATAAADLVVNTTPVGMHGTGSEDESPLPAAFLRQGLWVCDLVYRPPQTRLLRDTEAAGANALGGLEMLVLQAVESVKLWTGREPPVDIMRSAARSALGL